MPLPPPCPQSPRDSRGSALSAEDKVRCILEQDGRSFCEELEASCWWLCAVVVCCTGWVQERQHSVERGAVSAWTAPPAPRQLPLRPPCAPRAPLLERSGPVKTQSPDSLVCRSRWRSSAGGRVSGSGSARRCSSAPASSPMQVCLLPARVGGWFCWAGLPACQGGRRCWCSYSWHSVHGMRDVRVGFVSKGNQARPAAARPMPALQRWLPAGEAEC